MLQTTRAKVTSHTTLTDESSLAESTSDSSGHNMFSTSLCYQPVLYWAIISNTINVFNYVDGGLMHDMIRKAITVKPLITDPLKSGQPLYSNWFYHTTNTLQTSEKWTPLNFKQPARHQKAITPYFSWSGHLHHCMSSLSTRILYLLQSTCRQSPSPKCYFLYGSHISPTPIQHE